MSPYRFLDHTADLRIEVEGGTLEELFREAAAALFDVIVGLDSVEVREFREVRASGEDTKELLVDWLRELLYRFDGEGMVFSRFEITDFSGTGMRARCGGEPFDRRRHRIRHEIKAVTYHGLEIVERKGTLSVSVVFDI
jgi:SHS2 domain-containing protein